jgi:hypothetical protein
MDRKLSDEQLERLAKNLLQDFTLDDAALDEIAESPRLWWNVRKGIETEKARREKSRFAAFRPPVLAFGALAILVGGGLAVLFLSSAKNPDSNIARQNPVLNSVEEVGKAPEDSPARTPENDAGKPEIVRNPIFGKAPVKNIKPKAKFVAGNRTGKNPAKQAAVSSEISSPESVAETKTDFIALSYAAETESGQIVRVKVPSSMMVSLGVAANVERESKMVNAEVVIGDDGLARAIRFIR